MIFLAVVINTCFFYYYYLFLLDKTLRLLETCHAILTEIDWHFQMKESNSPEQSLVR